jgi:hypothetical protein
LAYWAGGQELSYSASSRVSTWFIRKKREKKSRAPASERE